MMGWTTDAAVGGDPSGFRKRVFVVSNELSDDALKVPAARRRRMLPFARCRRAES